MNTFLKKSLCVIVLCLFVQVKCDYFEGDSCFTRHKSPGTCVKISDCPSAIQDLRNRINPVICSYEMTTPVVCCEGDSAPPEQQCPPVPIWATKNLNKTGQIAWDKCLDYMEAHYPCVEAPEGSTDKYERDAYCVKRYGIIGGEQTDRSEYPHMAVLGFGSSETSIRWLCGGSLISEFYILTAGHCTLSPEYGSVTFVRLGAQQLSEEMESKFLYKVEQITKHPLYRPPNKYHDIALLKLNRRVIYEKVVRPACLHLEKEVTRKSLVATGWGATKLNGEFSDQLYKVYLEEFTFEECQRAYRPNRHLGNGILDDSQVCAGDRNQEKDTCQGDSGGPLQISHLKLLCTYEIIGITSFGKSCATPGVPAVYTRVSAYVPWIESVVWK